MSESFEFVIRAAICDKFPAVCIVFLMGTYFAAGSYVSNDREMPERLFPLTSESQERRGNVWKLSDRSLNWMEQSLYARRVRAMAWLGKK